MFMSLPTQRWRITRDDLRLNVVEMVLFPPTPPPLCFRFLLDMLSSPDPFRLDFFLFVVSHSQSSFLPFLDSDKAVHRHCNKSLCSATHRFLAAYSAIAFPPDSL